MVVFVFVCSRLDLPQVRSVTKSSASKLSVTRHGTYQDRLTCAPSTTRSPVAPKAPSPASQGFEERPARPASTLPCVPVRPCLHGPACRRRPAPGRHDRAHRPGNALRLPTDVPAAVQTFDRAIGMRRSASVCSVTGMRRPPVRSPTPVRRRPGRASNAGPRASARAQIADGGPLDARAGRFCARLPCAHPGNPW
jgi:hypothetical protein